MTHTLNYKAKYRCHLCGTILATEEAIELTPGKAKRELDGIVFGFSQSPLVSMYFAHYCADGSVGVAQFIGWERVNE